MIIKVRELCWVDYIKEEDFNEDEKTINTAIRTVVYKSSKETLLEAFNDYQEHFDSDNILDSNDEFDGDCLGTIMHLSIEAILDENAIKKTQVIFYINQMN